MLAYADGDARAFERLYARHRRWLHAMLQHQLHTAAAADDVFQETWFSVIRSAPRYRPDARFSTWLYLLARQRLVDHWRRADPGGDPLAFDEQDGAPPLPAPLIERRDPASALESRQLGERIERAIRRLPPLQREAWLLAQWRDMSHEEIATATGSSPEAVKSRLRYARAKLGEWLGADRPASDAR